MTWTEYKQLAPRRRLLLRRRTLYLQALTVCQHFDKDFPLQLRTVPSFDRIIPLLDLALGLVAAARNFEEEWAQKNGIPLAEALIMYGCLFYGWRVKGESPRRGLLQVVEDYYFNGHGGTPLTSYLASAKINHDDTMRQHAEAFLQKRRSYSPSKESITSRRARERERVEMTIKAIQDYVSTVDPETVKPSVVGTDASVQRDARSSDK